jgi:serine/threonine protein kinase
LPYKHVQNLGHGHSGTVEEVEDQMTGKVYARKTIRITGTTRDKAERNRVFRNEVAIIRGLESHPHIISVHATYATTRVFGILLEPVASQGDLGDFLSDYSRELEEAATISNVRTAAMKPVIKQGFGCLAAGLAFMHQRRIRHKDIKPRNIIVHMGKLIYTDFGYSFDSNGFSRSTTEGRPDYFTRRYSAPEVLKHDQRNSKSDVYSLGCVFLDMLSTLYPSLIVDKDKCFSNTMQQLHSQLQDMEVPKDLGILIDIILRMTAQESSSRLCSMHAAIPLLQQIETCCSDCVGSPLQEENERVKGDNCVLCQGGKMKTTAIIYSGRSGTNLGDLNYYSSYDWVLKKWKRLRYNNSQPP